jgi:hypothetical protein
MVMCLEPTTMITSLSGWSNRPQLRIKTGIKQRPENKTRITNGIFEL